MHTGNLAWPQEMEIAEQDSDPRFNALLFARQVWSVNAGPNQLGNLWGETSHVPAPSSVEAGDLASQWEEDWTRLRESARAGQDPTDPDAPDFYERARAARAAKPTAWDERYEVEWPEDLYEAWTQQLAENPVMGFDESVLADLIPAWLAGLRTIVVLPVDGAFHERLSDSTLLVTRGLRADNSAMSALYASWRSAA